MKTYLLIIVSLITLASCTKEKTHSPFVTTWKTTVNNEDITIYTRPEIADYNYDIDWGDGHKEKNLTTNATHKYVNAGTYEVKITGDFPAIYSSDEYQKNAAKLQTIEQWGSIQWQSMEQAFSYCVNLTYGARDTPNLEDVTSMGSMFKAATSFNGAIGDWTVSNVKDMSLMFNWAESFDQDLSSWDMSNVLDTSGMFSEARMFNQDISNWDVSSVTDMSEMFGKAFSFDQGLCGWNVSNVTNMESMFVFATSFNQDISDWDVSNVINMSNMFSRTISFNQDISDWDVSNVVNMLGMFSEAISYNQNLSNWATNSVNDCANFNLNSRLKPEHLPTEGDCF